MEKRRRPSSAMDGFVPRNRTSKRRASLDKSSVQSRHAEAAKSKRSRATLPLRIEEDGWVNNDPDTVVLDDEEIQAAGEMRRSRRQLAEGAEPKKPHFWQIFKKRRIRKGKPEPSRRKKILRRLLFAVVLLGALVGGFLGWKVLKNATKVFNGSILGILDSTKLKGEDEGRVNILLAGTSEDDPGHDGAKLTDSIMVVSLDTKNNSAFMISIPRDLWVNYQTRGCSVGYQGKINAAYTCGEQIAFNEDGYAAGGIGLLEKIVEDSFGLDIHYYAKINYTAFRDAVDAVNGIDINLQTDSPNGILDRIFDWECKYRCYKVKYPNGQLHLNGEQALDLARARGDFTGYPTYGTGNDFGRTERQRQMLLALKDKALNIGILSNPAKLGSLLDAAGNNVTTDFKTNELRRLYEVGKKIDSKNIQSIGLTDDDVNLVQTFNSADGQSAVRPVAGVTDFSQIKNYINKLISTDPVTREGATVVILNASGTVGLAQTQADQLAEKGLNVEDVGNAAPRDSTTIFSKSTNKNSTKKYLEKYFGAIATTDQNTLTEAANYDADFVIAIGKNNQLNNASSH
ncbi:MAG: LCP family protein [Candidatus Saccharimonadales bacterium]